MKTQTQNLENRTQSSETKLSVELTTCKGLTAKEVNSSSSPNTYILEIPDNARLLKQFRENHPYLYRVLNRALWKNYRGLA